MDSTDKMYCVYFHINKKSGKRYIGITSQDPVKRWGSNGVGYIKCCRFWKAIQKYGWDNFAHEVCMSNLTRDEASRAEVYLINVFKTQDPSYGYNIEPGGAVSFHSEETKEKIREKNLGKIVSNETKLKIRKARAKQISNYEGLVRSSKLRRGKNLPEETKKKMRESCKDKCKKVACIETGIIYESITEATQQTGVRKSSISSVCHNGSTRTAGGYHWSFV